MKNLQYLPSLLTTALVATLGLTGCVVTAGVGVGDPGVGDLKVQWEINDEYGPGVCDAWEVSSVDVQVYDEVTGKLAASANFDCYDANARGIILGIPDGRYIVDTTLIGWDNLAATDTIEYEPIDIFAGDVTLLDARFYGADF